MRNTWSATAIVIAAMGANIANADELRGADSLFEMMQNLTVALGVDGSVDYTGGGYTAAASAMAANTQEIAPLSFLSDIPCEGAAWRCWRIGRGPFIAAFGNEGQACESGLAWNQTFQVTERNGQAGLQCPGCTGPAGDQFTISDWRTALRIIYAGQHGSGPGTNATKRCTSDVRHSLVAQWGTLFKDGCATGACPDGLRHAYRPEDASEVSWTLAELLQLHGGVSAAFCNGSERQDNDPIRRACDGNGFNGAGEEVCRRNTASTVGSGYNLGLVLPVLIPQIDPYAAATGAPYTQNCGTASLGGAAAGLVAWTLNDVVTYGSNCPNGTPQVGGTCLFPRRAGAPEGTGFGCIASRNDRPAGSAGTVDARIYNLWARNNDGSVKTYSRDATDNRANVSYYRNHQKQCTQHDATDQIACFVGDDACSMGLADVSGLSTSTDTIALGLRSTVPFDHDANPTTPNQFASVDPIEANASTYGLINFLSICDHDLDPDTGSQTPAFLDAQQAIQDACMDPTPVEVHNAVSAAGYIPFPPDQPLQVVPIENICP